MKQESLNGSLTVRERANHGLTRSLVEEGWEDLGSRNREDKN